MITLIKGAARKSILFERFIRSANVDKENLLVVDLVGAPNLCSTFDAYLWRPQDDEINDFSKILNMIALEEQPKVSHLYIYGNFKKENIQYVTDVAKEYFRNFVEIVTTIQDNDVQDGTFEIEEIRNDWR